jgi:hypothetical protein
MQTQSGIIHLGDALALHEKIRVYLEEVIRHDVTHPTPIVIEFLHQAECILGVLDAERRAQNASRTKTSDWLVLRLRRFVNGLTDQSEFGRLTYEEIRVVDWALGRSLQLYERELRNGGIKSVRRLAAGSYPDRIM